MFRIIFLMNPSITYNPSLPPRSRWEGGKTVAGEVEKTWNLIFSTGGLDGLVNVPI
jgi:hypothetical protein